MYNARKNRQSHITNPSRKTFTTLDFSEDGHYLVTGECGHQPHVRVWDVHDKSMVVEFPGHKFGINCVVSKTILNQTSWNFIYWLPYYFSTLTSRNILLVICAQWKICRVCRITAWCGCLCLGLEKQYKGIKNLVHMRALSCILRLYIELLDMKYSIIILGRFE